MEAAAALETPVGAAEEPTAAEPSTGRIVSLDVFRGVTILGMLLVNNIALDTATPKQLLHAGWNEGLHFADLVFPWFLLLVGLSIPLSAASSQRKGVPAWKYDLRVLGRGVTLFLFGCLVDSSFAHRPTFGLGVLQIIGMAYVVGALLFGLPALRRGLIAGLLLVGYWAAIRFVPLPDVGAGVFTESQNLPAHLNSNYLQPIHLRGLLSVIPTAALVLIGTLFGEMIRSDSVPANRKVAALLLGGLGLGVVGWVWNLDLPFNKPFWTSSYVLFAAGCGLGLAGILYLVTDFVGWTKWGGPFAVLGANAIVAYVAPILTKALILQPWHWKMPDGSLVNLQDAFLRFCVDHAGRVPGGWLYTWAYIAVWWGVLLVLYRKRIFVRV
jgi:predicted acyltransferase